MRAIGKRRGIARPYMKVTNVKFMIDEYLKCII
jgi:hypothetical protein